MLVRNMSKTVAECLFNLPTSMVALSLEASQTFCVEVDSDILGMFVVRARVTGDVSKRFAGCREKVKRGFVIVFG
jgi:hypothetical protein